MYNVKIVFECLGNGVEKRQVKKKILKQKIKEDNIINQIPDTIFTELLSGVELVSPLLLVSCFQQASIFRRCNRAIYFSS